MRRYLTVFLAAVLAWANLLVSDASGSAVVLGESWPGVDGSAWDGSRWVTSTAGTATVDTQGGGGRIALNGRDWAGAVGVMPSVADAEVLVSFRFSEIATEAQTFHWLRGSGNWADFYNLIPNSGLGVQIKNTDARVKVFLATGGGTRVVLAIASIRDVSTGVQWLRFRVEGNRTLVKVWNQGQAEPSGWEIDVTSSSSPASGVYQIGFSRSTGLVAREAIFDDLTVTNLGNSGGNTPPTVAWAQPSPDSVVAGEVPIIIEASDEEDAPNQLTVQWRPQGGSWTNANYNASTARYEATWPSIASPDGATTLEARASDSAGSTATDSVDVLVNNVNEPPVAIASVSCSQLSCTFDGTGSHDPDGVLESYVWDFGDGSGASGSTTSHTYADGDTYTVLLEVTDAQGAIATDSSEVTVFASGSAVVLGESWPGVDGSAWDGSRWVTSTAGTATVDTQGGGGRIALNGRDWAGAVGVMPSVADAEVLVSFRFSEIATEAQTFHWLRGSGNWADFYNLIPNSGLGVQIKNTDARVKVFLATGGGTRVVLAIASIRDVSTGVQWLRFRVEGNRTLVKVWNQGQAEPSGWEIDVTSSSSPASGVYQIGFSRSTGLVAREAIFDDLTVTNLGN